jgi:hypothetical protein
MKVSLWLQPTVETEARLILSQRRHHELRQSCLGVHRLRMIRRGSTLNFTRWSLSRHRAEQWGYISFEFWERKFS